MSHLFSHLCLAAALILSAQPLIPVARGAGDEISFDQDIRPILEEHCQSCHSVQTHQSGLAVETLESLLQGGGLDGPAVIVGNSADSPLVMRLKGETEPAMPMNASRLTDGEISLIAAWIDQLKPADVAADRGTGRSKGWPWTRLEPTEVPTVKRHQWVRNPIDAFILAALEERDMEPAPSASRRALLRRISFGLTGLPPSPEAMAAFLRDPSEDAYRNAVERLLDNPAYGERWGRHWLDLVRYSDTVGEAVDYPRPHMWRYRDYVIRAFNQDMPYDRFIRQQLAGDAYRKYGAEGKIATGFLHQWVFVQRVDSPQTRRDYLNDVVGTTGSVFLGVTLGCARCHDHKYDPIPTRDYYRMEAFFAPVTVGPEPVPFTPYEPPELEPEGWKKKAEGWKNLLDRRKEEAARFRAELAARVAPHYQLMAPQDLKDWVVSDLKRTPFPKRSLYTREEMERLRLISRQGKRFANPNSPDYYKAMAFIATEGFRANTAGPPATYLLKGGNYKLPGEAVEPGVLSAVTGHSRPVDRKGLDVRSSGGSSRKLLAEWIASPDNPLTARVMVNRIWQYHFGRGLVSTPSDLGKNGGGTVHRKLLDWLAWQFIESGWSIKEMHRLILQSNVYRQSLRTPHLEAYRKLDSDNRYLWRRNPIRLEAEVMRDSLLAISGQLNPSVGGPPFFPDIDDEVQQRAGVWWEPSPQQERSRRSLYVLQCRSLQLPMVAVFDGPNINESCPVRDVTTVTPQVFTLLNGRFSHQQARFMADRIRREAGDDPGRQVEHAFQLAFQRPPSALERNECLAFLRQHQVDPDPPSKVTLRAIRFGNDLGESLARQKDRSGNLLSRLCLVLMNMNEFVFLE